MKLLFDQNVSPQLVARLADVCPGWAHVADLGLDRAGDDDVWRFAASPPRRYLVRVVVDIASQPVRVVTAYRTSKVGKYWRIEP